jgi:hypothetical protein
VGIASRKVNFDQNWMNFVRKTNGIYILHRTWSTLDIGSAGAACAALDTGSGVQSAFPPSSTELCEYEINYFLNLIIINYSIVIND